MLNPAVPRRSPACGRRRVRIKALGLGKQERSREKAGMLPKDPEPDVVLKRLEVLRSHCWSSYPAYAGYVEKPSWLYCDELWRRGCDKKGADPKKEYRGARWGQPLN